MKCARESVPMAAQAVQRAPGADTVEALHPRPRGRRWQRTRRQIQQRDGSLCAGCGLLWVPWRDAVDHKVPREVAVRVMAPEQVDSAANLQLLCDECHAEKSAAEAAGKVWTPRGKA